MCKTDLMKGCVWSDNSEDCRFKLFNRISAEVDQGFTRPDVYFRTLFVKRDTLYI